MPYRIAGIDVHKRMLAVVIADVAVEGEYEFERRQVGASPGELQKLAEWLVEQEVEEVVMESTAQYWRPVWSALEEVWMPQRRNRKDAGPVSGALHLAQAQSNRGAAGRKRDFPDAERLVKRYAAGELTLSFVPDVEQRLWRTVMRRKYQLTCNRVQLQNRLECLLEEARIKLSSLVSDLLGQSARRMMHALAEGETNPARLATLGDRRLRATSEQLCDALGACTNLHPVYRRLLRMTLEELRLLEEQITELDQQMASLLSAHQDAVMRLAEVPGLGVDSAHQIIAEVGASAATFPSAKHLSSWVGACPGNSESAGVNHSHRSPKGNCQMRRVLNQAANAAVKTKGSIFELVFRRLVVRLGYALAIGSLFSKKALIASSVRNHSLPSFLAGTTPLRRYLRMHRTLSPVILENCLAVINCMLYLLCGEDRRLEAGVMLPANARLKEGNGGQNWIVPSGSWAVRIPTTFLPQNGPNRG